MSMVTESLSPTDLLSFTDPVQPETIFGSLPTPIENNEPQKWKELKPNRKLENVVVVVDVAAVVDVLVWLYGYLNVSCMKYIATAAANQKEMPILIVYCICRISSTLQKSFVFLLLDRFFSFIFFVACLLHIATFYPLLSFSA